MEKQNNGGDPKGNSTQGLDYKSAILKGIEEVRKTAGSEEIVREWEDLKNKVCEETEPWKLHFIYHTLIEQLAIARGEAPPKFTIKTKSGHRVYNSVQDYLDDCK